MEAAVKTANWVVNKVVNKLSDDLVDDFVASSKLGINSEKIKADLMLAQALLHEVQGRDDNPGLKWHLEQLSQKADEAEDALDELHYFIIQDSLDNTNHATPDLGGGLCGQVRHARTAACHTIGNWLSCFSWLPCFSCGDGGNASRQVDKLAFDRVAMSNKIKSVLEAMHSKCLPVSDLLKIHRHSSMPGTTVTVNRPVMGSGNQNKLYGRSTSFEKTIKDITGGTYRSETLYVLPIVGPGGIGKTTFTQHLYNDKKTEAHFAIRIWVCVSTDFDVFKLTQQIHNCILVTEKQENNIPSGTANLDQLQISIANRLKSKRFLIVLDDVWKCDTDAEWNSLLFPLTNGEAKGSMVLVTTRFPKIEEKVNRKTIAVHLRGLDPEDFWEFFQACVFGEEKPHQQYDELIDTGKQIADKLKCSPLAAGTVARLLKKNLSWEHWSKVLHNDEWKNEETSEDIMPSLKISYDYLPFYLKKCFSYFSLYPEDHRFTNLELTSFWTAIGIIDSNCHNNKYLKELVDNGFLIQEGDASLGDQCFVMHDLMHELSRRVSAEECVNISNFSFSANSIPHSVQHLSITMDNTYDENFMKEMAKLKSKINVRNLRSLMIFREYEVRIEEVIKHTFKEIEGLRILFIVMNSQESLPENFPKLIHLRYLKLGSRYGSNMSLPSVLPRFYHLIFLDLEEWEGSYVLPKSISRLVNLRHFIAKRKLHSNVPEVGNIEHLEELKEFHVQKESVGFELKELGKLSNLRGELRVCNLEKVSTKEEASKANLALKRNLKKLALVWGKEQWGADADVIDGLQPPYSIRELVIKDDGGAIGLPSWLFADIPITHLESLTLEGVSWVTLPPFGQLPYLKKLVLKDIPRVRFIGHDPGAGRNHSFMHLEEVEISDMPALETWTLKSTCNLFPVLQHIKCEGCPSLLALPFFSDCSVSCTQDILCPSLHTLVILKCPKLSLPPMPPAPFATYINIKDVVQTVLLMQKNLLVRNYSGVIAFQNMSNVENLRCEEGSITSWTDPQKATSLRQVWMRGHSSIESLAFISGLPSLTFLMLNCFEDTLTSDTLKLLITAMPGRIKQSHQLEELGVNNISAVLVAPTTLRKLYLCDDKRVESLTEDEEESLQLLTSLNTLHIVNCPGLPSLPQGLHNLSSLTKLLVMNCPEIESLPKGGLPSSLKEIEVFGCSAKLHEQVKQLRGTNPELRVTVWWPAQSTTTLIAGVNNLQVFSAYSSADDTSLHVKSMSQLVHGRNHFG